MSFSSISVQISLSNIFIVCERSSNEYCTVTPVGYPTGTQFVESHVAVELKTVLLQCLELNFIHLQCVQGDGN